jgi:hypothetical protein
MRDLPNQRRVTKSLPCRFATSPPVPGEVKSASCMARSHPSLRTRPSVGTSGQMTFRLFFFIGHGAFAFRSRRKESNHAPY